MRPTDIMHTMSLCYACRQPVLILGSPGEGKTHLIFDTAKSLGVGYRAIRVPHLDVVDLRGLADLNCTKTVWKRPSWMPDPADPADAGGGIMAIGEATAGIPAIQATLYELFETRPDGTRHCAGHEIPSNWVPMGDGNKLTDRAVAHRLSTAMVSRVKIVELTNNLDDWSDWACGGVAKPVPIYKSPTDDLIEPEMIAFVRKRPELLNNFEKVKANDNEPYACPRSIYRFNQEFKTCKLNGISHKPEKKDQFYMSMEFVAGTVGKQFAAEFIAFLDTMTGLPSWEEITLDPDGCRVPEEPSFRYAVAAMVGRQMDKQTFDRALQYMHRLPKSFEVLSIQTAVKINRDKDGKPLDPKRDITSTKSWVQWAAKNKDVLFYQ